MKELGERTTEVEVEGVPYEVWYDVIDESIDSHVVPLEPEITDLRAAGSGYNQMYQLTDEVFEEVMAQLVQRLR